MIKRATRIFLLIFIVGFCNFAFSEGIEDKFKGKDKLIYDVTFNNNPAGKVEWEYLGREIIDGKVADVLYVVSDTKILGFFDLASKEKVFIDNETYLPIKVERDLVVWGKGEIIEELYDQEKGEVKISITKGGKTRVKVLKQDPPIRNILAFLYFFPPDIKLEKDKIFIFNLPTQKVRVRMVSERLITTSKGEEKAYFILGRGGKKFNLWLDKVEKLPLRIEFPMPALGEIRVERAN